jgi:subtilisin family serine protease
MPPHGGTGVRASSRARLLRLGVVAAALVLGAGVPSATEAPRASAQSSAAAGDAAADWQAAQLDLPLAWQVTEGSPDVVVAVVDTGVDGSHAALAGRVMPGFNLLTGTPDAGDDNGHGTALAGIVAATCPGCRILPVKVLAANGTGDWDTIAAGVRWAADHGAQVINLSVGAPRALDVLGAAVSYALSRGSIVVAAAGNDGRNETFYPAAYAGVVSVAGVDENGARYAWSNFGTWVTAAAPGCATTTWLGGQYKADFCGTSTAAPFVAGVAGLARSFRGTLSADSFTAALRASTSPLPDPTVASSGAVDANRLLLALGAPAAPPVDATPPGIAPAPRVGRRLAAATGVWRDGATYAVRWQRSRDGVAWQDVGSGRTYAPQPSDLGASLRIVVTVTNARGSTTAASAPSRRVAAPARHVHTRARN